MNGMLKILILLLCMGVFWAFSESFLVSEKQGRPRSTQQLKQEIAEIMGSIVQESGVAIEKRAQAQQVLCKQLKAFADNDKTSFFARASVKQLQDLLVLLKDEHKRIQSETAQHERFLTGLTSNIKF